MTTSNGTQYPPIVEFGRELSIPGDSDRVRVGPRHHSSLQLAQRPVTTAGLGEYRSAVVSGDRIVYRQFGDRGPVVVLLHGMGGSGRSWDPVPPHLATSVDDGELTLVIPDLLGHGGSAKPRTDYSPGAHANVVRDLLDELGHDRVALVGHSLGGGIALQFAYQYGRRCRALMLVASGGLGGDVAGPLRAAALPGSGLVLRLLANRTHLRGRIGALGGVLGRLVPALNDADELQEVWDSLGTPEARAAFLATLRAVIDSTGQRVSALHRLPGAGEIPTLLVWGSHDRTIPVRHAQHAHEHISGSQLIIFPEAGHFPHRHDPARFAGLLLDFARAGDHTAGSGAA
jgi:pimeloyl-ACP methyl ester carboxylesterase